MIYNFLLHFRGILIFTSIFLTIQTIGFIGTIVFYMFASTGEERTRDRLAKLFITNLYDRHQWRWLRQSRALEMHILISLAIQLMLLICCIFLIVGASRGIRYLLIPWLTLFGFLQVGTLVATIFSVILLPKVEFKVSITSRLQWVLLKQFLHLLGSGYNGVNYN